MQKENLKSQFKNIRSDKSQSLAYSICWFISKYGYYDGLFSKDRLVDNGSWSHVLRIFPDIKFISVGSSKFVYSPKGQKYVKKCLAKKIIQTNRQLNILKKSMKDV